MAIGGLLVLPVVWTLISTLTGIGARLPWLYLAITSAPIAAGELTATTVLRFTAAAGAWVLIPLVIGIRRVLTSEVK